MTIAHVQSDTYTVLGNGTQSFSVTHPGGSNVLLLINFCISAGWGEHTNSELYNSGAGTLLGGGHSNGGTEQRIHYWIAPSTGSNTIAWSGPSASQTSVAVLAEWFTGVDQTTPIIGPDTVDELTGAFSTPSHTALTAGATERLFMATVAGSVVTWPGGGTNVTVLGNDGISSGSTEIEGAEGFSSLDGYDTIAWGGSVNSGQWASTAIVLNPAVAVGAEPYIVYERRRADPLILL